MNEHDHVDEGATLSALASAGYLYPSMAALRTSGVRYGDAIPILLSSLEHTMDRKLKTEIVRALSVPWAGPDAATALIDEFRIADDETGLGLRWTIGNALEIVWDDQYFDELVNLARDVQFGRAREMVVLGFRKSSRPEAVNILIELLRDADVSGHAVKALRKLRAPAAKQGLRTMLNDERAWVRKEARAALDSLT